MFATSDIEYVTLKHTSLRLGLNIMIGMKNPIYTLHYLGHSIIITWFVG